MSIFSGIGSVITNLGHAIGAPDLGVGRALGDQHALPGLIQGVNPTTFQGIGYASSNGNGRYGFAAPSPGNNQPQAAAGYAAPSGGGGVAAPAYDPNTDPSLVNAAKNNIYGDQNSIQNLYNAINGQLTQYGQDQRGRLDGAYNQQLDASNKSYATGNDQTAGAFAGRNAGDSSYLGDALQSNKDAYNTDVNNLNQNHDQNLASLGNTLNSVKSQLDSGRPQYNLGQYNDVGSLQNLHNQLGDYIKSLQGVQNNYLTNGQLKGKLDSIAPATSSLAGTLKGQIDKIIAGPGDSSAKLGIANTYISQLPADQQDPYKQYLNQQITPLLTASK